MQLLKVWKERGAVWTPSVGGEVHVFSAPRPTQSRRAVWLWAKGYDANIAVTLRG